MKVSDGIWSELARRAGVRPPHIWHLSCYRKTVGDKFSVEGYAAFAMIDAQHVVAMLAVLDALPTAKPRVARQRAAVTRLSEDWVMPEDWVIMGRDRRMWTLDVCRTEAERFVNWHRMKGTANADWKAAWRNWIDGSRREDGQLGAVAGQFDDPEARREYLERLR